MLGKGRQIRGCWGLFSLATRPADALIPGDLRDHSTAIAATAQIVRNFVDTPGCDACHGGDPASADAFRAHRSILNSRNPAGPVHRGNIVRTCGTCHTGPYVAFQGSRHFELLKEDDQRPPVCTTCHSEDGVGGNPQFPAQARGLLESIREVRTLLDEAQPLIRRVADADRRQELEEQYQQAEVPVIEAVQFDHSFNFERVEERRETDRRRADALLEVLANPQ